MSETSRFNKIGLRLLLMLGFSGGVALGFVSPTRSAEACTRTTGSDDCGCYCDSVEDGYGTYVSVSKRQYR